MDDDLDEEILINTDSKNSKRTHSTRPKLLMKIKPDFFNKASDNMKETE